MTDLVGFLKRNWVLLTGPMRVPKSDNALKFGILGAANIAPMALIGPARSHPGVVIQAVASRDKNEAAAYAKKHGIPHVMDSYQAILDDPSIDCVYVPLPNGLHYEWTLRALAANKHVLLEKPSTATAEEAEILFNHPLLQQKPKAPVLMEAFHYRLHPAWSLFMSFIDPPNVVHAQAITKVPRFLFPDDDIRFTYSLGGGTTLDLGTYGASAVRLIFGGALPEECTAAHMKPCPPPREKCDESVKASFRFANGGTADIHATLRGSVAELVEISPRVSATHRPVEVPDATLSENQEKIRVRRVHMSNFMLPTAWHRIDVEDDFVIREKAPGGVEDPPNANRRTIKSWSEKRSVKGYTWAEAGVEGRGDASHWMTYRHMLDQFVNRIRGEAGSGLWIEHDDSVIQARMLDMMYEKSGLGLRETSTFRL